MLLKSRRSWLMGFALLASLAAPRGYADGVGLSVAEPFGIERALRTADREALLALAKSPLEDVRRLATASLSRLDGKLDESDSSAEACYTWAVSQKHFMTATRCLTIEAGNAYLRSDDRRVAEDFARVRREFTDHVSPTIPANARYWPAEFMPEGARFTTFPPESRGALPRPGEYAFKWAQSVPMLSIQIDGHAVDAIFDTGSMKSALSDDVAETFGLKSDGQWLGILANNAIQYSSRYVGEVSLLGVSMGPRSFAGLRTPGMAIIGRDIMHRLDTFEISSSGLRILAKDDQEALRCTDRMLEGSSFDGTFGGVYLPIVASGVKAQAFFDTGHTTFLSQYVGSAPIHWPASEWTIEGVTRANEKDSSSFHLVDGYLALGQSQSAWLQGKVKLETSQREEPGTYALGSLSLKNVRYVFDFGRHHLCAYAKEN